LRCKSKHGGPSTAIQDKVEEIFIALGDDDVASSKIQVRNDFEFFDM
jgi:hypothetical protein